MNLSLYFQIPYKKHGRDEITGLDCYGFIRYYFKIEKGIFLPTLEGIDIIDSSLYSLFYEVKDYKNGDVVLLANGPFGLSHTGIVIDSSILHMTEAGVSQTPIKKLRKFIEGFYRLRIE